MKKWLIIGIVVVLGVVAYNLCRANQVLVPEASITSLHVVRTSQFTQNHIHPFEMTVTDAAKAQQIYDSMRHLSPPPAGTYHCGADLGVAYALTFTQRNGPPIEATATSTLNCGEATFAHGGTGFAGSDFWNSLATTLGVPVSELDVSPMPNSSGPIAPTPAPPTPTR